MRSIQLSIYLIKANVRESGVLRSDEAFERHAITDDGVDFGALYVRQSGGRRPSWARLFADRAEPRLGNMLSQSVSGIWILPVGGRILACAFGYGRMLMNPSSFEEDFGLKVTLNCVDPTKVHSIDRTTLDTISRHSQIQASHLAPIGEFGLDVEQDILQAVTGEPSDSLLGKKLSGKDSLHVSAQVSFQALPALLERYVGLYSSQAYREFFAFVDHIRLIKDPVKLNELNDALVDRIRSQNADRLWLSVPESIEWRLVDYFRYKPSRQRGQYDDLHFGQLAVEIPDISRVDLDRLRTVRVQGISTANDFPIHDWQLFKCLNHEVADGNRVYVLNNGKWYEVASDFAAAVDETCRSVRLSQESLPQYEDRDEASYNRRVVSSDPGRFVSFDRGAVVFPSSPSRIEFCDLYTNTREMIFVKRYADSKVLSHLFAQGVVSAETFRREPAFRQLIETRLPPSHSLGTRVASMDARDFTVTFAVVSESARPLHESLPFFSKVNLRNAVKLLRSNGYEVRLAKVQQERRALGTPV